MKQKTELLTVLLSGDSVLTTDEQVELSIHRQISSLVVTWLLGQELRRQPDPAATGAAVLKLAEAVVQSGAEQELAEFRAAMDSPGTQLLGRALLGKNALEETEARHRSALAQALTAWQAIVDSAVEEPQPGTEP